MTAAAPTAGHRAPLSLGATVVDGKTHFRLFADAARACAVRLLNDDGSPRAEHPLEAAGGGYHEVMLSGARHGTLYEFVLDGRSLPDPYARFLPRGVHGPAMVTESAYEWIHGPGIHRPLREQVIYEVHLGAFTPEGTYAAAALRLPALAELGVTAVELMPLSAFPGTRGWGYDGVAHFAPYAGYGTPDQLRSFIDQAHGLRLSVLLDVVYNHFGPAGNYLPSFSPLYFSGDAKNAWGDGPNWAHPPMRAYVLSNARYWLDEFRFDGLRLDATHAIVDRSQTHILKEVTELAHGLAPRKVVIAEDDRNEPDLMLGLGLDGVWADDFHHVAHVTLTGETDGYYSSYSPGAKALAEVINRGWLYEGQVYPATGKPRGRPAAGLPAEAMIYCLQNHDQVGNRAFGDRLSDPPHGRGYAALSTVLLFLPMTPLLFMGQEWAATSPFQYFTEHEVELGRQISSGRRAEFQAFRAFADPTARERIPDPQAESTFTRSKPSWEERQRGVHAQTLRLYTALLALRRSDVVLRDPSRDRLTASTGPESAEDLLIVRRVAGDQERVLLANLSDRRIPEGLFRELLGDRSLLLRSDLRDDASGDLPGWTALIAAGPVSP